MSSPVTGAKGKANPRWAGDQVGYKGAHIRVRTARGSASDHECVDCGKPASQWSYNGNDPNELTGSHDEGRRVQHNLRYSADPDYYDPRCAPCHGLHDRKPWCDPVHAATVECPGCGAGIGHRCRNKLRPNLTIKLPHPERFEVLRAAVSDGGSET